MIKIKLSYKQYSIGVGEFFIINIYLKNMTAKTTSAL